MLNLGKLIREMSAFMDSKEKSKEAEKCLDPQIWHACAGGMVQNVYAVEIPNLNDIKFLIYFSNHNNQLNNTMSKTNTSL